MALQYPKSVSSKSVISRLGDRDEFKTMREFIKEYEETVCEYDENADGDIFEIVKKMQGKMKEFVQARDVAWGRVEKKLKDIEAKEKKAKTDKEKTVLATEKKPFEKDNDMFEALSAEMEGGHKLLLNQLTTIQKETDGRVKWDDYIAKNPAETAFLNGLEQIGPKQTALAASALMQISEAFRKLDPASATAAKDKKDLKERLEDLIKMASKKFVTGGGGYDSFEEAFRTIRNKYIIVQLSPLEAKGRDDFLKRLGAAVPIAIKRRDTIQKSFTALTTALAEKADTASAPGATKTT